jgi:thioredoxin-dependent peroxiredoxin
MTKRAGMMVGDNEHNVQGAMLQVGQPAPDFALIANDLSVKHLSDYDGKIKVISCIPSLDTSVCSAQTRHFNQQAEQLGGDIVILTVSADLPFAQKRWCGTEGVQHTETLSDHKTMQFAESYGVHDTEWRVLQRAAFVLDRDNIVRYIEYVPVIGDEVAYDTIIAEAKALL